MLEPLTGTEARISDLVAHGATNDEIAAALGLSPKTVEWNLTKVYRRLGIRSRTELALLVLRQELPGGPARGRNPRREAGNG